MKTRTVSYVSGKLDRSNTPKPTFESTAKVVIERIVKGAKHLKDVVASMMYNGRKFEELCQIERNLILYNQWGVKRERTHHERVQDAVLKYQWEQHLIKEGRL